MMICLIIISCWLIKLIITLWYIYCCTKLLLSLLWIHWILWNTWWWWRFILHVWHMFWSRIDRNCLLIYWRFFILVTRVVLLVCFWRVSYTKYWWVLVTVWISDWWACRIVSRIHLLFILNNLYLFTYKINKSKLYNILV